LYRAVDSQGQTIDFCLTQTRNKAAARRFFRRALAQPHVSGFCCKEFDEKSRGKQSEDGVWI